jgi:hypothetical protein
VTSCQLQNSMEPEEFLRPLKVRASRYSKSPTSPNMTMTRDVVTRFALTLPYSILGLRVLRTDCVILTNDASTAAVPMPMEGPDGQMRCYRSFRAVGPTYSRPIEISGIEHNNELPLSINS